MKKVLFFLIPFVLTTAVHAEEFGLYSETYPGAVLDTDSFLGLYSGPPEANPGLPDAEDDRDPANFRDGRQSFRVDFRTVRPNQFQGWFVQWGDDGTPDSVNRDMTAYANGSIRFWVKAPPELAERIEFGIRSGDKRPGRESSKITLSRYVPFDNQWHPVAVSVAFISGDQNNPAQRFADLRIMKVLANFGFSGTTGGTRQRFFVDNLRWDTAIPQASDTIVIDPDAAAMPVNSSQNFTIQAVDANGTDFDIWPTWTVSPVGAIAKLDRPDGIGVTLTSGVSPETLTLTATDNTILYLVNQPNQMTPLPQNQIQDQATVEVTEEFVVEEQQFGLLAETISGVNLDVDSKLGVFPEHVTNAQLELFGADGQTFREGKVSFRTEVSTIGSVGWFIQWGDVFDSTEHVKMTSFAFGSLRFWFRGDPDLEDLMEVGIRSKDVTPGVETSKVQLKDFVAFDGAWHPVVIPISNFIGAAPKANLDQIQTLITFAVTGNTNGRKSFWVDKVRWDNRTPGPLDQFVVKPNQDILIPTEVKRDFQARAEDANGVELDIWPVWTKEALATSTFLRRVDGDFVPVANGEGEVVGFETTSTEENGTISVSIQDPAPRNFRFNVEVRNLDFAGSQAMRFYFDEGLGTTADVGVAPNDGSILLEGEEVTNDGAPGDSQSFMRADFTLADNTEPGDDFAAWFVFQVNGTFFVPASFSEAGFLQFYVRTHHDLEISMRSDNIPSGNNPVKILLSELGVPLVPIDQPLDGAEWSKVAVSLSFFKSLAPDNDPEDELDFSKMKVLFSAAALSSELGEVEDQRFDIDDVKYITLSNDSPEQGKVYQGLVEKLRISPANPSQGLVRSYGLGTDPRPLLSLQQAVTYDNAVSAMTYLYNKDINLAESIFNTYVSLRGGGQFGGFWDEYHVDNLESVNEVQGLVPDKDRLAGPNAWLLLALVHHRAVAPAADRLKYEPLMQDLARWLLGLRDPGDGAIYFGFNQTCNAERTICNEGSTLDRAKSTEHNKDCYAAFRSYAQQTTDNALRDQLNAAADGILNWLQTDAWDSAGNRFYVGERDDGSPNSDRALDVYAWAPLALKAARLTNPDIDFRTIMDNAVLAFAERNGVPNIRPNGRTGVDVHGFDFDDNQDAVWIEGTLHAALAYHVMGSTVEARQFLEEARKTIFTVSETAQALTYATNGGTAFGGWPMNSRDAAASSMAWFLFADNGFNPFQPLGEMVISIRNISDNQVAEDVRWGAPIQVFDGWKRADQYVELFVNAPSVDYFWNVQMYTENTNPNLDPHFVDRTPEDSENSDSNPAGLLIDFPGNEPVSRKLLLAYSVKDNLAPPPVAESPILPCPEFTGPENAFQWQLIVDAASPAMDLDRDNQLGGVCDTKSFEEVNGTLDILVADREKFHGTQGVALEGEARAFFPRSGPDYIFWQADFTSPLPTFRYKAHIVFELYFL